MVVREPRGGWRNSCRGAAPRGGCGQGPEVRGVGNALDGTGDSRVWEHDAAREDLCSAVLERQRRCVGGHWRGVCGGRQKGRRRRDEKGGSMYCGRSRRRCVGSIEVENGPTDVGAISFPDGRPQGYLRRESQDAGTAVGGRDARSGGRVVKVQELLVEVRTFSTPFALRCVDESAESLQGGDAQSLPARSGSAVVALVAEGRSLPHRCRVAAEGKSP
jgi:hypothetical protein